MESFKSAGLDISSVLVANRGDTGPLGRQNQGYQFLLLHNGDFYQIYIEDCENWQKARAAIKRINNFNRKTNGHFPKAANYGNIGIIYSPDNKEVEALLLHILREN